MDIHEEIGGIESNDITMILTDGEDYAETNRHLIDHLVEDHGIPGIYITVNKPYRTVKNELEEHGVPTGDIFFVDAITKETGGDVVEKDHVLFLDSPEDLTELGLVIEEAVDALGEQHEFLFLDSLTTLTIYHELDTVAEFTHFLTGKMRHWDVAGVILSLEESADDELIDQVSGFCDRTVRL